MIWRGQEEWYGGSSLLVHSSFLCLRVAWNQNKNGYVWVYRGSVFVTTTILGNLHEWQFTVASTCKCLQTCKTSNQPQLLDNNYASHFKLDLWARFNKVMPTDKHFQGQLREGKSVVGTQSSCITCVEGTSVITGPKYMQLKVPICYNIWTQV